MGACRYGISLLVFNLIARVSVWLLVEHLKRKSILCRTHVLSSIYYMASSASGQDEPNHAQ